MTLNSYVKERPLLLNEGSVSERYRWLYELEIMMTYLPQATYNYEEAKPINRDVKLRVQVGRIEGTPDEEGLVIESMNIYASQ